MTVVGCLALLVLAPVLAVLLPALFSRSRHEPGSECRINLQHLKYFFAMYETKFGEEPQSLRALFNSGLGGKNGYLFVCPVNRGRLSVPQNPTWADLERWVDYEYRPPPVAARGKVNPNFVIAWDKTPHPDGTRSVMFGDKRVGRLDERELQEALKAGP